MRRLALALGVVTTVALTSAQAPGRREVGEAGPVPGAGVFGGLAPGWSPRGLVFEYDPGANRWTKKKPMPVPRHGLAGGVIGNRLHLVSGDVQSAGIAGMHLHADSHDAFELEGP